MQADNPILRAGQVVQDKWEILEFLAQGGKGEVYLARQINLDRQVALKVMSREFLRSLEDRQEEYDSELQRFRREVRIMARIRHPNVLQVYDFGQIEADDISLDYIVMEYVPGQTLRATMPQEGFGQREKELADWITRYFFPVLDGIGAVHAQGVVHRDMKPENVLIDDEIPKIADFGLAGGHHLEGITRSFHIMGTPPYMPEEQFTDLAATDSRTDVYALGKILYEAIEGRMTQERDKPFQSVRLSSPSTRMMRSLDRLVQQATARDRTHRTPTIDALRQELTSILEESSYLERSSVFKKHKRQLLLTGAVSGLIILLLFFLFGLHLVRMDSGQQTTPGQSTQTPITSDDFSFSFSQKNPTTLSRSLDSESPPRTVQGSDGMSMRLVPGGIARIMQGSSQSPEEEEIRNTVRVSDFYMDETKVTNHLYVEFLRQVPDIEVRDNAVWRNGRIWLFLGEARQGYEPILYREGEFVISSDAVSNPVVRVTATGAMAYASFYGRSLPSMAQWWRAVQEGAGRGDPPLFREGTGHQSMMQQHMNGNGAPQRTPQGGNGILPVSASSANSLGIRGLGRNVNEWVMAVSGQERPKLHIHGGVAGLGPEESYLERRSWEGFADTGFRTTLSLSGNE